MTNQGYQQPCSSSLPCYSPLFSCDNVTNTCLCPKSQIGSYIYYTQYYTGGVTDLYSGELEKANIKIKNWLKNYIFLKEYA